MPLLRNWPSPFTVEGGNPYAQNRPARLHDDHGPGTDGSRSGSSAAKPQKMVSCPELVPEPRSAPAEAYVREAGSVVHTDPAITLLEAERARGVPDYDSREESLRERAVLTEAIHQLVDALEHAGIYRLAERPRDANGRFTS